VLVLAAVVGATDIDPFVINIAQGGVQDLSMSVLSTTVLVAASSNNIAKAVYAAGFGGLSGSRRPASMLIVLAMAGVAVAAAMPCWFVLERSDPMDFRGKFNVSPSRKFNPGYDKHENHVL
jgi:uncharacterized membrane protein (DUF4010 family)